MAKVNLSRIFVTALIVLLSGCASDADIRREVSIGNLKIATQHAQREAKPLMDATIPIPGCEGSVERCVMRILVNNPTHQPMPQVAMPDNPTARVWEKAIDQTGTFLNIAAGGASAVAITKAVGAGINKAISMQPSPVVVEQERVEVVRPEVVERQTVQVVETPAAQVVNPVIVQVPAGQIVNPVIVRPEVIQIPTQVITP
jgi:hypothetical protein